MLARSFASEKRIDRPVEPARSQGLGGETVVMLSRHASVAFARWVSGSMGELRDSAGSVRGGPGRWARRDGVENVEERD